MPVYIAPAGAELTVRKVGAEEKVKKHLQELGITEGSKIKLLSSSGEIGRASCRERVSA